MMNMNKSSTPGPNHPFENVVYFKRWSFWWMKDLFRLGLQRTIESSDIYQNLSAHDSEQLSTKFEKLWKEEKFKRRPRLLSVIVKMYWLQILSLSIGFAAVDIISRALQSQCLGGLVTFFSKKFDDPETLAAEKQYAYYYAAGMILCTVVRTLFTSPFMLYATHLGLQVRVSIATMIFKKMIKVTKSCPMIGFNGRIVNMMTFDATRFENLMSFSYRIWKGPLELLVFSFLLYLEIGFYAWIGVGFITLFVPIQIFMGKMAASYRLKMVGITDSRIRIMNELVQGIQIIKMYAWERPFAKLIDKIRKNELKTIRGMFVIRGILMSFDIVSRFAIFLSLASYVYFGNVFTSSQVFIVTSYFNFLYDSMLLYLPIAITSTAECFVSAKRVEDFLLLPEEKEIATPLEMLNVNALKANGYLPNKLRNMMSKPLVPDFLPNGLSDQPKFGKVVTIRENDSEKCVIFNRVTAIWNKQTTAGLYGVSFEVKDSEFCAIIGQVGSGKSTILQTILRELEIDRGELTVKGVVSYAAQEPWLFEATVRQNILFTEVYDDDRYKKVVHACALERDLQLLPYGDNTVIGERGISLSGGQRARISLARAIYRKADIYLLDDPLSAVDTMVGKHIFEQCIKGFLADKICILVTHQEQFLRASKNVVIMDMGKVDCQGSYADLKNVNYQSIRRSIRSNESSSSQKYDAAEEEDCRSVQEIEEQVEEQMKCRKEAQIVGSVGWKTYKSYFSAVNSRFLVSLVAFCIIFGQLAISFVDVYISKWVNWETSRNQSFEIQGNTATMQRLTLNLTVHEERLHYVYVYSALMIGMVYVVAQKSATFFSACLRASQNIHNKLFDGIIHAKMYFFHTNASGRIINRFSQDIMSIDALLPIALYDTVLFLVRFFGILLLVALSNYWLLIPTVFTTILFYGLRRVYVSTARCLKRIEAISRSPIISHTNTTITGLTTIHAFKSNDMVINEFYALQNHNVSAWFLFTASGRAMALWSELLCAVYMSVVIGIFFVFQNESGTVGMAITQIMTLVMAIQWGMRQTAELENNMTSVERIMEYVDLEPEEDLIIENHKLDEWPKTGNMEFINLTMKYSAYSKPTLKSLNLTIKSGEKIGIVGRTGAGKSSVIQAIFRLANNEGTIKIDGVDISSVPLNILRQNISTIPQDAVLFSGSMRDNLDPFQTKSDDELWNALDQVELRHMVSNLPNGLDFQILENGGNFSMGQRQLVCLARAILQNNKILILDEATANVDASTDKFIQKTIRDKFAHCTVLTIAHRLKTVIDTDRVLIMDAGEGVEFDHSHNLLQNADSIFTKLVEETGFSSSRSLRDKAKKSLQRRTNATQLE